MKITYFGVANGDGTFSVSHCMADAQKVSEQAIVADAVVTINVPIVKGALEPPYGDMSALVIVPDKDGNFTVRPKGAEQSLLDSQITATNVLKETTAKLILSVCNERTQNSLALIFNTLSNVDKKRAKLYFAWHKNMLTKHNQIKKSIVDAKDQSELNKLTSGIVGAFQPLMDEAPHSSVDLMSYVK